MLINLHIYPSAMINESRIFKHAKFLSKNYNFKKIILLGFWKKGLLKKELHQDNIIIKRVSFFRVKNRAILYFYYYIYILIFIIFNKPKLINVHSLEFLPITLITKILKLKIVYEPHELETEKIGLSNFRKKISKFIEYLFIKKVDRLFVVGEKISNWYAATYKIPKPPVILNSSIITELKNSNYLREKYGLREDQLIILYQGNLGLARGIDILLEAFKKRKNNKIVLVFIGSGKLQKKIQNLSKRYDNIFHHVPVPYYKLLEVTTSADIGVFLCENKCLSYNYCMPNKLFEYLMAGLPVIVSNLAEIGNFVKVNKIGFVVSNYSVDEINNSINKIVNQDLTKFKNKIKKISIKTSWNNQEINMKEIYKKILNLNENKST